MIHWFRRDLRVADNTALHQASRRAELVIPVFILEKRLPGRSSAQTPAASLSFLLQSLAALRAQLTALGYPLIVRRGDPQAELAKLCQETRAEAVFCNRCYEPGEEARESRVFYELNGLGIGFESCKDAVVWEERELLTQKGDPYTVFTPYAKAWSARTIPAPRPGLPPLGIAFPPIAVDPLPFDPAAPGQPGQQHRPIAGELAAGETLQRFLSGPVSSYRTRRDFPALDGTSRLSPHLRAGAIGIRTVFAGLAAIRKGASTAAQASCDAFLKELVWREFYLQILANFPHVARGSFRPEYDALDWSADQTHFQAWCEGQTGYPIVDAAMRCLNATGWMHNRLRMITAMFLTKDLLINWQWGERYFMQLLIDGDLASNNGGWQWCAGTGTDAAPYFRIFNPVTQAQKFDPDGAFVRQWLPELATLPDHLIHQPWTDPAGTRDTGYPMRIVLHEEQRKKCLAMYQRVTRS